MASCMLVVTKLFFAFVNCRVGGKGVVRNMDSVTWIIIDLLGIVPAWRYNTTYKKLKVAFQRLH